MRTQDLNLPAFERELKALNGFSEISLRVSRFLVTKSRLERTGAKLIIRINPNLIHSVAEWEHEKRNLKKQIGGMK